MPIELGAFTLTSSAAPAKISFRHRGETWVQRGPCPLPQAFRLWLAPCQEGLLLCASATCWSPFKNLMEKRRDGCSCVCGKKTPDLGGSPAFPHHCPGPTSVMGQGVRVCPSRACFFLVWSLLCPDSADRFVVPVSRLRGRVPRVCSHECAFTQAVLLGRTACGHCHSLSAYLGAELFVCSPGTGS